MKVIDFAADADLVGRRVRIGWTFVPEAGETLADLPRVRLRRKTTDYDFPPAIPAPDPWLVYDSAVFPPPPVPGALTVTELPGWEQAVAEGRLAVRAVSVATLAAGSRLLEWQRRTSTTLLGVDGRPRWRRIEILDNGAEAFALEPGTTYYYQLFGPFTAATGTVRDHTTAGDGYALGRRLYDSLPSYCTREDLLPRPDQPGSATVPEMSRPQGQLRRFIDVFGAGLDAMRASAENLHGLKDIANLPARFLPQLASGIGWRLDRADQIPLQRNELVNAARLYRRIGTVPGLRAVVERYSGWTCRVAEFAQQVWRANQAPRSHLLASRARAGEWLAVDAVATALGFGPGNRAAIGTAGLPAMLTGSVAEPFVLPSQARLDLAIDGRPTRALRLADADFTDPTAVTAAELATVLDRLLVTVRVSAVAGALQIETLRQGPQASLQIAAEAGAVISLPEGPAQRPAALIDAGGRLRVIGTAVAQEQDDVDGRQPPAWRLRVSTQAHRQWWDEHEVNADGDRQQAWPAAVSLPDGRLWLSWLARRGSAWVQRSSVGQPAADQPAQLFGEVVEPFALTPGTGLALIGSAAPESLLIQAADYVDPANATAAEVAAAAAAQLVATSVVPQADGSLALISIDAGPAAWRAVDLAASTAARALGFGRSPLRADGNWTAAIAWSPGRRGPATASAHLADGAAVVDPAGGVRRFWSRHRRGRWRLATAHWDERRLLATAAGLAIADAAGVWSVATTVDGLAADDCRAIAVDADGDVLVATAAGLGRRTPAGLWSVLDSGGGLQSDDLRDLTLAADGAIWLAGAGGVDRVDSGGGVTGFDLADGLPSLDCRALLIAADDTIWLATAGGLAWRDSAGLWTTLGAPDPLPSADVRRLYLDDRQRLWIATAAGLASRDEWGDWRVIGQPWLPSLDLRDVLVDGERLWVATAAGLAHRDERGAWRTIDTASGLPSNDIRRLELGDDGLLRVTTAAGLAQQTVNGWSVQTVADGLPSNDCRHSQGPWSSTRELAGSAAHAREPTAAVADTDEIWLLWSEAVVPHDGEDRWALRQRRFDPVTRQWNVDQAVTSLPLGALADREPWALARPGSGPLVTFRSTRAGGSHLWQVTLDAAGIPSAPLPIIAGPAAATMPVLLDRPDGERWLLYRSDGSLPLAQVGIRQSQPTAYSDLPASETVPDAAALRHYAGTTTPVLADLGRNVRQRQWGDLLAYTSAKPDGGVQLPYGPEDFHTRHTIGLFVDAPAGSAGLTQHNVDRIRRLLAETLPMNLRVVIVFNPTLTIDHVYGAGIEPTDGYQDDYPQVEVYSGLSDSAQTAFVDWFQLFSNTAGHLAVDPASLASLRGRTYRPGL